MIDADGQQLLRTRLPRHWLLREYRPDYGLDYSLEVFRYASDKTTNPLTYETLGEHLFIQLKTVESTTSGPLKIYGRYNVEKRRETLNKDDLAGELETLRIQIETPELVTVERMGAGVPVLLVVADLTDQRCYFICLNDYIDKVLIPRHDDYTTKASRTIHVPKINELCDDRTGPRVIRWYGKRQKLYAAFQRFAFQFVELQYAADSAEFPMARYFASRISRYDFWSDTEMWKIVPYYGSKLEEFLATGSPSLLKADNVAILSACRGDADAAARMEESLRNTDILELWRRLAGLSRDYEDVCREWFLPTSLGVAASYSPPIQI